MHSVVYDKGSIRFILILPVILLEVVLKYFAYL